jgi:4'-phosphopantetheinyl transferase
LLCPISACGSLTDAEVGIEQLDGWRDETAGPFFLHLFCGNPPCLCRSPLLLDEIARELSPQGANLPSDPVERSPVVVPPLLPRQLHLWRIHLDQPAAACAPLAECLSPEEERRAARFVRQRDRRRFVVSHAALRMILGQYLGLPPERVEIEVAAGGKPSLAPVPGLLPLMFNLSHSEELALVGVTLEQRIGVDVEHGRSLVDAESIVKRYFSAGERARWQALAEDERLPAFFRGWTRKEAYLKARGVGLSAGLDRFEVSFAAGEPTCLVEEGGTPDSATRWQVYDVSPGGGYAAACAVEGEIEKASLYDWSPLRLIGPTAARVARR